MALIVQAITGTGTSLSFLSPTTAGNCVVACLGDISGTLNAAAVTAMKLGGVVDNFGASALQTAGGSPSQGYATIWADPNCSGGQTAVAATASNTVDPVMCLYEISSIVTSSVLDSTGNNSASTSASWTSLATGTTTGASDAIIGVAVCGGFGTLTGPASLWTNHSQAGLSATDLISGSQLASATGTFTYSGTINASEKWAAAVVALKGLASVLVPRSRSVNQAVMRAALW